MSKMKFKDLLDNNSGITKGPFGGDIKKAYFVPKGEDTYKVYEQGVVYENNVNYGTYYIDSERYNKLKKFEVLTGDILLTGAGTLGELFVVPENHEKGVINQALLRIRLNSDVVDKDYFLYYFKWYIKNVVCRINGDSVIPNLPPIAILKETDVDIPEIEIQRQIAKTLKIIDSKIENNNKINAELESMAKTIYDYWFLQFEFPNEEGKPYKSSGGKMVWNEELKREIPEGWEVSDLSKLCDFNNGINYDKEELGDKDYKIVNVRNISSTTLLLDKSDLDNICLQSNQADKYLVEDDDILIARSGTPGAVRLLESDVNDIIYCGFIIRCKPKNKEQRYYLTYSLKLLEGSNATKTGGSILQNVSQETLKQISVCIPPNEIVKKYNESINDIFRKMQNVIEENRELTSLRDFLLPMLMNGQVGFKD